MIFADLSVSLEGFVAGPNPSLEDPLGIGGKLIHSGLRDVVLIYDLLMCVNIARCEQRLPAEEVEAIVISVMQRHLREKSHMRWQTLRWQTLI